MAPASEGPLAPVSVQVGRRSWPGWIRLDDGVELGRRLAGTLRSVRKLEGVLNSIHVQVFEALKLIGEIRISAIWMLGKHNRSQYTYGAQQILAGNGAAHRT